MSEQDDDGERDQQPTQALDVDAMPPRGERPVWIPWVLVGFVGAGAVGAMAVQQTRHRAAQDGLQAAVNATRSMLEEANERTKALESQVKRLGEDAADARARADALNQAVTARDEELAKLKAAAPEPKRPGKKPKRVRRPRR